MIDISKIIPSDAWVIPIGKTFTKKDYPEISFRVPWEQIHMTRDGARQGCPVGGMGAGSIGRSYFGDFARWQIIPYEHIYDNEVYGSQFHLFVKPMNSSKPFIQTLMAGSPKDSTRQSISNVLSTWPWSYPAGKGVYAALFPKVWCDYSGHPENPINILLEQFSPVIPHNYFSSSLPLGLYTWHVHNPLKEAIEVAVLFTFENMVGRIPDKKDQTRDIGDYSQCQWSEELPKIRQVHKVVSEDRFLGISLSAHKDDLMELPVSRQGEFAISVAKKDANAVLSYLSSFDCRGDGNEITDSFFNNGKLPDGNICFESNKGTLNGAAVCATIILQPDEANEIPMVLSWDFPEMIIQESSGRVFKRKYTEYKKTPDINALDFARIGIQKRQEWSEEIDKWHNEVRTSVNNDPLLTKAVLNEQYYLLDGGTLWEADTNNFGFLESIDYLNYETLDVRFYYSFTTLRYWPDIENHVLKLFGEAVSREDKRIVQWKYGYDYGCQRPEDIKEDIRLVRGACPHDLGRPPNKLKGQSKTEEEPFVQINAYGHRNVNFWKDLNTKYVLMVYRNYYLSAKKEIGLLRVHWTSAVEALQYLQQYDTNGDFIPENSGFPDQTYDTAWHMKGMSAYCGGLWLAALEAMIEMGKVLNESSLVKQYQHWLTVGKESFHNALWNGEYYDCYEGCKDVMADQLCGQWYTDLLDLPPIDEPKYIVKAYRSIFKYNCLNYLNGKSGVVTGITTDGVIPDEEQTPEVWIAVNYSLASAFFMRGLKNEAMQIVNGIHSLIWEKSGLWWSTPEAISYEEITEEMLERVYKFIRMEKGDSWIPPLAYTMEKLAKQKIYQMRAPQYSRPMSSSVFLYALNKTIK